MFTDHDDLTRDVFCVLGVPVDNIAMPTVLDRIEAATETKTPFLISTPNVNFIVNAGFDEEFKKTVIFSDLCLPDGMWLVRLGRLMGIPFVDRVAGSDLLDALKARRTDDHPIKFSFFGGSEAAGQQACAAINGRNDRLRCVGGVNPGYGSVEDMSEDRLLSQINATDADFLLVALGAKKGQTWLHANHDRLTIPVRAHLGATINFYAGLIKRAPEGVQRWGLEWAWRIKEEPLLWRRYAHDGAVIALMFFLRIAPLMLWSTFLRLRRDWFGENLKLDESASQGQRVISLGGALTARNAAAIASALRSALSANESIVLDLSGARAVDARFAGLLWMLHKTLARRGRATRIVGAPILIRWLLGLYGFEIPARAPKSEAIPADGVLISAAE